MEPEAAEPDHAAPARRLVDRVLRTPAAVVLAPVLVFFDALLGRRVLGPGDGAYQYLPWYLHNARSWRTFWVPGINAYQFAGFAHLAAGQPAAFYPPTWLFLVLPPVLANNVGVVLSFVVAGAGAWALARRLTGDHVASLVGGLSYGLCGYLFARVGHESMLATAAWLPWVVLGLERLRERATALRLLAAGGALALSFLAGHSQVFATVLAFLGVYALVVAGASFREDRGRTLLLAGAMVAIGLAIAAIQLVPTVLYLPHSDRQDLSFEQAMTYAIPRSHAPLLLFPHLFGTTVTTGPYTGPYTGTWNLTEMTGYAGAAAAVLAAAGLGAVRRDRRAAALLAAGVACALLAFGPAVMPFARLVYELPIYGQLRAWARNIVGADLAVAMFAAWGVAALRSAEPAARRAAAVRAAVAAAVVVAVGVIAPRVPAIAVHIRDGGPDLAAVLVPAAAAVCAAILAFVAQQRGIGRGVAVALVALVAADPIASFGAFYEWRRASPTPSEVRAAIDGGPQEWGLPSDAPGGIDRHLYLGGDVTKAGGLGGSNDLRRIRSANGNDPLAPRDYIGALGMAPFGAVGDPGRWWRPGSDLADLLRVTTIVIEDIPAYAPPEGSEVSPVGSPGQAPWRRFDRRPLLPDAFVVGAVEVRSRAEVIEAITGSAPFDPRALALVEEPCQPCPRPAAGESPAFDRAPARFEEQRVVVDVRDAGAGLLVVSQAHLPGWRATVDGRRAEVLRADGLLLGVPVGPGAQEVVLWYRPPGLRLGAAITALALLALAAAAVASPRRHPDHAAG